MGGWSARKALQVAKNVEHVLAIELFAGTQGIDFLRPLKSTYPIERVHELIRLHVEFVEQDRYLGDDIRKIVSLIQSGQVFDVAELQQKL